MTDQRNRVTTDPGLGPVQREHASTLRSMRAADPVPDDEITGAPVYYEPKPLHAVSDHKTLELETVKVAKDIDPRKLPTELKLRRPVLHVLPASDPNWPAPEARPELGWPQAPFDSNWPPPETVLTSSQPPLATRRRSYIPLVVLVLLAASLLLVLGARARHRSLLPSVTAQAMQPVSAPTLAVAPSPPTPGFPPSTPVPASSESAPVINGAAAAAAPAAPAAPADSAESAALAQSAGSTANSVASAALAPSAAPASSTIEPDPNAAATPPHPADASHRTALKPAPLSIANSQSLSAPPAKQKRAIY